MLQEPQQLCLGIDENAALVVDKSTVSVVSGDDIAQCYLKKCIPTKDGYDVVAHAMSESHAPVSFYDLIEGNIIE